MMSLINQIRQLAPEEQLAIVHQIWDGLRESSELVQQWQVAETRRRAVELAEDASIAISEEEVWERVDQILDE